jgi:hypothetical protein
MCSEWTKIIKTNFLNHFDDRDSIKYRRHKATIAANKMIRIFDKYAGI